MKEKDEVAVANEKHWDRMVKEGCGYTIPWLELDVNMLRNYASGKSDVVPTPLDVMIPRSIIADVKGKDVLCLASGGGQQSAMFGLLGANVTVVDLSQGQLDGDIKASKHYGYEIKAIQSDMRDLSCLKDESFDIIYGTALCYVPDIHKVYSEVARLLRQNGIYRTDFSQPSISFIVWDGNGYKIEKPYCESIKRRSDGAIEFRHYMDDIFNGLIDVGLSIRQVVDVSKHRKPSQQAIPGNWDHEEPYIGGWFVIVAEKK